MAKTRSPVIKYEKVQKLARHPVVTEMLYRSPYYLIYRVANDIVAPLLKSMIDKGQFGEDDQKNISEIIKAGKEQGVEELNIDCDKNLGIDFDAPIPIGGVPEGVKITFKAGSQSKTRINVKYK